MFANRGVPIFGDKYPGTLTGMGEADQKLHVDAHSRLQKLKTGCLKGILVFFLLLPSSRALSPGFPLGFIEVSEPVDGYKRLIDAIVMVESSGDRLAINALEEAYGAFQIRPIRLLDYYQRTGKRYTTEDCFSFEVSKEIFLYYALNMGYPDDQAIARNWNGSGRMTLVYWEKVKKHL
jgi:hypothetical protein